MEILSVEWIMAVSGGVALVAATVVAAIKKRNGDGKSREVKPPPPQRESNPGAIALDYEGLADTRNPLERVSRLMEQQGRVLDEISAAIEDEARWCTKADLGAVSTRLEGVEEATSKHTDAIAQLTNRMVAVETTLNERDPKK